MTKGFRKYFKIFFYRRNITINVLFYKIDITSNKETKINMQRIVGSAEFEHYPSIGIVNKIDPDILILPINKLQRTVNLGSFSLKNFTDCNFFFRLFKFYFKKMFNF